MLEPTSIERFLQLAQLAENFHCAHKHNKNERNIFYKNVRANRLTIYRLLELLPAGCCVELLVLCVWLSKKQRQEHWNTGTATTE